MKAARIPIAALLLALGSGAATPENEPQALCVLDVEAMPPSWRPSASAEKGISAAPWSAEEGRDAAMAARKGLDELAGFFAAHPSSIPALGSNAVESLIDASYAAANMPDLKSKALAEARKVLEPLMAPQLSRRPASEGCKDFAPVLELAIYARALLDGGDERVPWLVALANAAYRACGSLAAAIGSDYRATLAAPNASVDRVWDLVMWSITLTDAQLLPGLSLPDEAYSLPPKLWRYLASYRLPGANDFARGARDARFYDVAYLATHIAYIPTGYGRYAITPSDAPWLYNYLRQNFYRVLEVGELDLTAEFVDLFRQYGCTESNDLQLRDGTRYLLRLYHAAGDSWMKHREADEHGQVDAYDLIHKAWTGMSAMRARMPEPPMPGTYAAVVRSWLRAAREDVER